MDREELARFLREERTMTCATLGPDGLPHLMPLWYVVRDGRLWAWTFAKSQKTKNLERDPRATLQIEAGRDVYQELRGVMFETETTIHRDVDLVTDLGLEIFARYGGGQDASAYREMVKAQAAKRVGLEFVEHTRATWDHRKLGGTY
jgi:PPOX class probable F420-dependent enzyme